MKQAILTFSLIMSFYFVVNAQTMRYFEFKTDCSPGNWQDSSFIAATDDQIVIDSVLANIAKTENERKFISGSIGYGNDGVNHNADHWFLWHFIPNEWELVEVAIELCDGCPYTDLDADTSYWVGTVGQFCPWSGIPVKEVSIPVRVNNPIFDNEILFYPNPVSDKITLNINSVSDISIIVFNSIGQEIRIIPNAEQHQTIDISELTTGVYFMKFTKDSYSVIKKVVVNKN